MNKRVWKQIEIGVDDEYYHIYAGGKVTGHARDRDFLGDGEPPHDAPISGVAIIIPDGISRSEAKRALKQVSELELEYGVGRNEIKVSVLYDPHPDFEMQSAEVRECIRIAKQWIWDNWSRIEATPVDGEFPYHVIADRISKQDTSDK